MTGLQRKTIASFSIVVCLLIFMVVGTTAAGNDDLEIKELKYKITGSDEETVSLALIIIVCNNTQVDSFFDVWIDMFNSKGEKIGSSGQDGVIAKADSDTKLTENVTVPAKKFSPPLKLKGALRNVKAKR